MPIEPRRPGEVEAGQRYEEPEDSQPEGDFRDGHAQDQRHRGPDNDQGDQGSEDEHFCSASRSCGGKARPSAGKVSRGAGGRVSGRARLAAAGEGVVQRSEVRVGVVAIDQSPLSAFQPKQLFNELVAA